MKRLFLATDFPDEILAQISEGNYKEKKIRWLRPELIHLTLAFLGEYPENRLDELIDSMKKVNFANFQIKLDSCGVFPNVKYTKVFWLGVSGNTDALKQLHFQIKEKLGLIGIFLEDREFLLHVTIGRIRHGGSRTLHISERFKVNYNNFSSELIKIKAFHLYESEFTDNGLVYTKLHTFPLDD